MGVQAQDKSDVFSNHTMKQFFDFAGRGIQVKNPGCDDLLAAESQKLHGEGGGTPRRVLNGFDAFVEPEIAARVFLENLGVAENNAKKIVEVVRNSPSQPADGFHLLGLKKLALQDAALGNVFGEDLVISRRVAGNTTPIEHRSDELSILAFPWYLDVVELVFLPMLRDEPLALLWVLVDVARHVELAKLGFGIVPEHPDEGRIGLKNAACGKTPHSLPDSAGRGGCEA